MFLHDKQSDGSPSPLPTPIPTVPTVSPTVSPTARPTPAPTASPSPAASTTVASSTTASPPSPTSPFTPSIVAIENVLCGNGSALFVLPTVQDAGSTLGATRCAQDIVVRLEPGAAAKRQARAGLMLTAGLQLTIELQGFAHVAALQVDDGGTEAVATLVSSPCVGDAPECTSSEPPLVVGGANGQDFSSFIRVAGCARSVVLRVTAGSLSVNAILTQATFDNCGETVTEPSNTCWSSANSCASCAALEAGCASCSDSSSTLCFVDGDVATSALCGAVGSSVAKSVADCATAASSPAEQGLDASETDDGVSLIVVLAIVAVLVCCAGCVVVTMYVSKKKTIHVSVRPRSTPPARAGTQVLRSPRSAASAGTMMVVAKPLTSSDNYGDIGSFAAPSHKPSAGPSAARARASSIATYATPQSVLESRESTHAGHPRASAHSVEYTSMPRRDEMRGTVNYTQLLPGANGETMDLSSNYGSLGPRTVTMSSGYDKVLADPMLSPMPAPAETSDGSHSIGRSESALVLSPRRSSTLRRASSSNRRRRGGTRQIDRPPTGPVGRALDRQVSDSSLLRHTRRSPNHASSSSHRQCSASPRRSSRGDSSGSRDASLAPSSTSGKRRSLRRVSHEPAENLGTIESIQGV
eukprot:CAMPEP_0170739194 /NCGR_PEP_ID=MMETSP0437-20130122/5034_1 /TAXON_ID=0 /ORGANISM="Sexangularia sp." /LENGTH=639 /DNA_ID=CAMNT_0011077639 /DNA_START=213 /DNA_END=2130 /DNA_ORIENTATION=-